MVLPHVLQENQFRWQWVQSFLLYTQVALHLQRATGHSSVEGFSQWGLADLLTFILKIQALEENGTIKHAVNIHDA